LVVDGGEEPLGRGPFTRRERSAGWNPPDPAERPKTRCLDRLAGLRRSRASRSSLRRSRASSPHVIVGYPAREHGVDDEFVKLMAKPVRFVLMVSLAALLNVTSPCGHSGTSAATCRALG
jgi:hypothetical protein